MSTSKAPLVAGLGAVPIDYRSGDFVATLRGMTDGVDAVFDPIGCSKQPPSAGKIILSLDQA